MVHQDVAYGDVVPTLLRWSDAIKKDYVLRNFAYLPGTRVQAAIGDLFNAGDGAETDEAKEMMDYFSADWRPLISYYNFVSKRMVTLHSLVYDNNKLLVDLKREVIALKKMILDGQEETRGLLLNILSQMSGNGPIAANRLVVGNRVAVTPPSPARTSNFETPDAASRTPPQYNMGIIIPNTTKDLSVVDCFVHWHTHRWYEFHSTKATKHTYNTIRNAVTFLGFFLDEQVPALPAGLQPRDEGTQEWAGGVRNLATAAFANFKAWRQNHVVNHEKTVAPTSLKRFADEIKEVPHSHWPAGPSIPTPFAPPEIDSKTDRKRLMDNQESRDKKRQKVAAAASVAPAEEDG